MNFAKLCCGCFKEKDGESCPYCGFSIQNEERIAIALPIASILNGRYMVGKVLGVGGFGITYLGFDLILEQKVAIKEYMPTGLATREPDRYTVTAISQKETESFRSGETKFLDEARILARLKDTPHIVSVYNYFNENGSAYFVMAYVEGMSLKEFLRQQGGRISSEQALAILLPIMTALGEVHAQGLLHRDISPDNIYITHKGESMLLDFGAARFALSNDKSFSVILKHGYAPEEQYRTHGNQGPWTDIYAMGATFYTCVTGNPPPDAIERVHADKLILPSQQNCKIPAHIESALLKALSIKAEDRFENMESFVLALGNAGLNAQQLARAIQVRSEQAEGQDFSAQPYTTAIPAWEGEDVASSALGSDRKSVGSFLERLKERRWLLAMAGGTLLLTILIPVLLLSTKQKDEVGVAGGGLTPGSKTSQSVSQSATTSVINTSTSTANGSTDTSTAQSSAGTSAVGKEMQAVSVAPLGLSLELPADLQVSEQEVYGLMAESSKLKVCCYFAYACGAPIYTLEDYKANATSVATYMLAEFGIQDKVKVSSVKDVLLGEIPASEISFTVDKDASSEWTIYGFAPLQGPGSYLMMVAQSVDDPQLALHKEQTQRMLNSIKRTEQPISPQVLVKATSAGVRMIYNSLFGVPENIADGELFHMYFTPSSDETQNGAMDIFDLSDHASNLDDALLFLTDSSTAFASISATDTLDIYQVDKKQARTAILDLTLNDDPNKLPMHEIIHVVKIGQRIFALTGFYDDKSEAIVKSQLDAIAVSMDSIP